MWQMDWVADYPGADDFLGLLLGSGQTNNFGRWANTDFDSAVAAARAPRTQPRCRRRSTRPSQSSLDQAP